MTLCYNSVSPLLLDCLRKLMSNPVFDDFVLVGGTALSLHFGHRESVDIDLFTSMEYGSMNVNSIKSAIIRMFSYTDNIETFDTQGIGYSLFIGESKQIPDCVKLDIYYTDAFIRPICEVDGLRIASLPDLAAMKLDAILHSKRKKDFWDIHELLEHYSLNQLIQWGLERNPYGITEDGVLSALDNLTSLTQDNFINCYKGKYWEIIVEDIKDEVSKYRKTSVV